MTFQTPILQSIFKYLNPNDGGLSSRIYVQNLIRKVFPATKWINQDLSGWKKNEYWKEIEEGGQSQMQSKGLNPFSPAFQMRAYLVDIMRQKLHLGLETYSKHYRSSSEVIAPFKTLNIMPRRYFCYFFFFF